MNYFLCAWNDGGDSSHTVIKQGQNAVSQWLRDCLQPGDIGCSEWIVEQLDMLDNDAGHGGTPIQIMWQGADHQFSITEITDLGAFSQSIPRSVCERIRAARNWLNADRFKTRNVRMAQSALENCMYDLGMPIDG